MYSKWYIDNGNFNPTNFSVFPSRTSIYEVIIILFKNRITSVLLLFARFYE